jgi:hypothetical protein
VIIARQSTARTVTVGPVLDADGAAVTDSVVADLKIAKNGGAPAALNGSATLTHRATGHYSLALTAADLDTVGQVEIIADDTVNACPVKEITVLEEAVYDALFAASATGALPVSAGGIAAAAFAAGAIDAAALAADAGTEIATAVWASGTRTLTSLAGLTVDTVTTLTNLPAIPANWLTAAGTAADFGAEIADAVWDEALAGHAGVGSTGAALSAAGSAGDPWSTPLPGAYGAGTAGKILGDNLNATVSSRATQTSVDTIDDFVDTEIGAITTHLTDIKGATFSGATDSLEAIRDRGDAAWTTATGFSTHSAADVVTALGTGASLTALATAAALTIVDDFLDTEIAAIKAKTDTLPASFPSNFASLAISAGGVVSADAKAVNGVTLTGTGVLGDEWGPA